jgi:hypothetical protein
MKSKEKHIIRAYTTHARDIIEDAQSFVKYYLMHF